MLTAALLHATWNALAKSGGSPLLGIASYQLVGAAVCLCLVGLVPLPLVESWPYIFASVLIHNIYYFSLARAYQSGDLSVVYPIFRGLAPVLVAIGASIFAAEYLSVGAMLGIALVSAGLMSLAVFGGKGRPDGPTLKWGIITAFLIASYTIVDGLGVRQSGNSLSFILWLFVFEIVPVGTWLLLTRAKEWRVFLIASPMRTLMGGIASSAAYGLIIYAMGLGAMALVSSLRETSVVFAAIIGALLLKEPFGRQRIIAAALVAGGVVLIRLFAV